MLMKATDTGATMTNIQNNVVEMLKAANWTYEGTALGGTVLMTAYSFDGMVNGYASIKVNGMSVFTSPSGEQTYEPHIVIANLMAQVEAHEMGR